MSLAPLTPPAVAPHASNAPAHAITLPLWVGAGLAVALIAALFGDTFLRLLTTWELDANYSHGYIVLPISLILAYRIGKRVGPPIRGEIALGLISIAFGLLCQSTSTVIRSSPLSYIAVLCVIRGLLVSAGGRKWAGEFTFPLLFLFFMFPLPVAWTSYAALWLQDIVSRVSETVLGLFVVCQRVGHTIRIAGVDRSLVVAEECSGLGQIVSFLAFAALLGHLLARPTWYRITLLVVAVPVAVVANTLRVVLMNLGAAYFGTKWMTGILHDLPALFSIPVGIILFLLFDRVLSGLIGLDETKAPEAKTAEGKPSETTMPPETTPAPEAHPVPSPTLTPMRGLLVAAAVLAVGVAAQFALTAHLQAAGEASFPTLTGQLESLPLQLPDPTTGRMAWAGLDLTDARDALRKKLPFVADDLLMRGYQNADGATVQLYMVHSRAGDDRKHHPEICIRDVSGAPEDLGFRRRVPLRSDGSAEAQRFQFQTGSSRAVVVYYWHYTLLPAPDASLTRLQSLHQRVGVAAPSVTVQVSTGVTDAKTLEAIEKQLLPALDAAARDRILPAGTETGCNRIPIALARQ